MNACFMCDDKNTGFIASVLNMEVDMELASFSMGCYFILV